MENYIEIGSAFKPHGLKGEVRVKLHSQTSSSLKKHQQVLLKPLSSASRLCATGEFWKIALIKKTKMTILKIAELDCINQLEPMLPFSINLKEDELAELKSGEYYLKDLIGLKVIDSSSFKELGVIESFRDGPGGINLIITGGVDLELPFRDQFFPKIDLEEKIITCNIPEYI